MVVPLSLDPGHYDPRSPLYLGHLEEEQPPEPEPEPYGEDYVQQRIQQRKRPYPIEEEAEAVAGEEP
jgi:hypothetical protein